MAGDIANRDITAGAPDAIVDMKYGNSYDPYIARAYKGDTLIYERVPDVWLYHIENVVSTTASGAGTKFKQYQPEYIYYLQESIQPFSWDNFGRDWEFRLKAAPSTSGASNCTLPLFTSAFEPYNHEYIGGETITLYLRYNVDGNKNMIGIDSTYPSGLFAPYGVNDRWPSSGSVEWFNFDVSQYGNVEEKEVHIVKQLEIEGGEEVNKIYFYLGGILFNTAVVNRIYTSNCRVGSIARGSNSGFVGTTEYYKFRFNTDPIHVEYNTYSYRSYSGGTDGTSSSGDSVTEVFDDYSVTTTNTLYFSGCSKQNVTVIEKEYYYEPDKNKTTHSVGGLSTTSIGDWITAPVWSDTYNQLTDNTYDGFGIEFIPRNSPTNGQTIWFNDDTAEEYVTVNSHENIIQSGSESPFIFNGGGTLSSENGHLILVYDKYGAGSEHNSLNIMGFSCWDIIGGEGIKAIYFNDLHQCVVFNARNGKPVRYSGRYNITQFTPSASRPNRIAIGGYYSGNSSDSFSSERTTYMDGESVSLFRIKYESPEQEGD